MLPTASYGGRLIPILLLAYIHHLLPPLLSYIHLLVSPSSPSHTFTPLPSPLRCLITSCDYLCHTTRWASYSTTPTLIYPLSSTTSSLPHTIYIASSCLFITFYFCHTTRWASYSTTRRQVAHLFPSLPANHTILYDAVTGILAGGLDRLFECC